MCPRTYYENSGYQCYPLIVKITYNYYVEYTCSGWNIHHTGDHAAAVIVTDKRMTNCEDKYSESSESGTIKVVKHKFWLKAPIVKGCNKSYGCTVRFKVYPRIREWNRHNGIGTEENPQEAPFYNWDAGNPELTIKAEASRGNSSDSDKLTFEPTNNPDPESDFSAPNDQFYDLVIEVKDDGDVSVRFEHLEDE